MLDIEAEQEQVIGIKNSALSSMILSKFLLFPVLCMSFHSNILFHICARCRARYRGYTGDTTQLETFIDHAPEELLEKMDNHKLDCETKL